MPRPSLAMTVEVVLAVLFALVMGVSIAAVLVADFMQPGKIMSAPARQTLVVCGLAGFLAGLLSWWLQRFAAGRGLPVRFLYAFGTFLLVFGAVGGLLEVARKIVANPAAGDFSLSGLYWNSVGGFYTFVLFLLTPIRLALFALFVAAGLFIAIVGPQQASD